MSEIIITSENFETEVLQSEKPVLLDFWAPWCGPCRSLGPVISEIANEHTEIKVGKINVDEQEKLASYFGVMSIPTLVVMKNGKIVDTRLGFMPKDIVEEFLKNSLSK